MSVSEGARVDVISGKDSTWFGIAESHFLVGDSLAFSSCSFGGCHGVIQDKRGSDAGT